MPSQRDLASIWDMIQAIQYIQAFTQDYSFQTYLEDIRTTSAVERQFEILGEAGNRISSEFQQQHPEINWRQIIGLRNIVAHRYDAVDHDVLWRIIQTNLTPLLAQLHNIIQSD